MADFTGYSLPQPRDISFPGSNVAATNSQVIGGVLTSLGNIGEHVLDTLEKRDARNAANDVGAKLTGLVQENFGANQQPGASPQLVGEPEPDLQKAAAASSPVVKTTLGQLDRLSQANKQGALSPQELMTRGSVIVQDAINANPLFANEIRQAAQAVLGTQPTQELVKLAEQDANAQKTLQNEVKHSQIMAAANAGVTYQKPDGTLDFDQMQAAGQQLLFSEKQMSDQLKLAQLATAAAGPKPTHEEQIAAETGPFIKTANPVYEKIMDGMMSSVPATVAKLANQAKPQQIAGVLQAVGTQQTQMNSWINKMILQNNISPDAAKQLREYYNAPFESFKALAANGDFSYFSTNAAALKSMNDTGQMSFQESAPAIARLHYAGGDQAVATMLNLFKGTNTPFRIQMDKELNGYFAGADPRTVLQNGANALGGGGYQLHQEQNPDVQRKTLQGVVGTLNAYTANPHGLNDTEQSAFGNASLQVSNLGLQSNDPKNLQAAADILNKPNTLATFDAFAKNPKNADKVPTVAQGMISLHTKAVLRNIPVLMQGATTAVTATNQVEIPYTDPEVGYNFVGQQVQAKAVPSFNPVTGRIVFDVVGVGPKGKDVPLTPQEKQAALPKLGDYARQVQSVNASLDAITHLAPSGVGREKDFKPLEIKQLLTAGAGLPVREGMNAVPMPKFMQAKETGNVLALPKAVADAQIQQESGGKNSVVSSQGAVGVAQIRPQNFPQYDAEKLKNDPEYALKARDEIMHDLLQKYNGNISLALAEYHAGPNQKQWGPKTFQYVAKILEKAGQ